MNVEVQSTAELTQLGALIGDMSIAMLTNVDDDGALVSRPMSPLEMDADGAVWFFVDATTTTQKHVTAVNLSFSDVSAGTFVSLSGRGEINLDRGRMERLWTPLAKPWFSDGPSSPDLALLKIVPLAAEYWDAPHSRMVRMFAMAAAVVTGQPVAIGEHDRLTDLSKDVSHEDSSTDAWDGASKVSSTVAID